MPQHVGVELAPCQLVGVRRRVVDLRPGASAGAAPRGGGRARAARCRRGRGGCARRCSRAGRRRGRTRQRRQAASSPAPGSSNGASATASSSRSSARWSESAGARSGERGVWAGSGQPCSRQAAGEGGEHLVGRRRCRCGPGPAPRRTATRSRRARPARRRPCRGAGRTASSRPRRGPGGRRPPAARPRAGRRGGWSAGCARRGRARWRRATRGGPGRPSAQMAGSTTKSAVTEPSSSAASRAGLSRTRRSRRNHITAEVAPRFEPRSGWTCSST